MRRRTEPAGRMLWAVVAVAVVLTAVGDAVAETGSRGTAVAQPGRGLAALQQAAAGNRYLFIFFWKENDQQARSMSAVYQAAMKELAGVADWTGIRITDPSEKAVVERFGVRRAPMPLVLAVAPNGAVTRAWPVRFTAEQLRQGLVSPCTARCMKALQDRKLVVLCIGNERTVSMADALAGAQGFKADARFSRATEIVTLNPEDPSESTLLRDLQVDPRSAQATTVLLAPPGRPIARFAGAVTKEQIISKVQSAASGCCPGGKCGPGGCRGTQR